MTQQANPTLLDNIRIVLVNTSHPGNIGAAARAMKNMGLTRLTLVDPEDYPSLEAISRSVGAVDLLDNAIVVKDLREAISGCVWVPPARCAEPALAGNPVTRLEALPVDWPVGSA